jgi:hypothetical protein
MRDATAGCMEILPTHCSPNLLQVLGQWYEQGKVLIFVQSQEKCDTLFRDLLKVRCFGLLDTSASWSPPEDARCLHIQQYKSV